MTTRWYASLLAMLTMTPSAWAVPSTHELTLRREAVEFYRWYLIRADGERPPFLMNETHRFLTPTLIRRLRQAYDRNEYEEDYFLKVQDYDQSDWSRHVFAGIVRGWPYDPRLLVTIGSRDPAELCVHLRHTNIGWRISGVDPVDLEGAPSDCRTRIGLPQ